MWNLTDLYVLRERVEDLLGHFDGFGEVVLAVYINYILPWVVPVEVTDWLLNYGTDKYFQIMRLNKAGEYMMKLALEKQSADK